MDGAKDAASWLYEKGKSAFDRHDYAEALNYFEFCLRKLREAHELREPQKNPGQIAGSRDSPFDPSRTGYRHLDDYLELCRTRQAVDEQHSGSPATHALLATGGNSSTLNGGGSLGRVPSGAASPSIATPAMIHLLSAGGGSAISSECSPGLKLPAAYTDGPPAPELLPPLAPLHGGAAAERTTLIMVCSPRHSPLPHLADEAVDVANATPSHIRRGGSAEDLRDELLRNKYRAFLFAGHGDAELLGGGSGAGSGAAASERRLTRTLGFTSASGGLETVRAEVLAELLGAHSPRRGGGLTTVFLNGCRTEEMAARVHAAGVPYVVCWRTKAHNAAARALARHFFASLAAGRGHAQAFEDAKAAVLLITRQGRLANGVPSAVPAYELRDPFPTGADADDEADSPPPPPDFTPPPVAAGIPVLLAPAADEEQTGGGHGGHGDRV